MDGPRVCHTEWNKSEREKQMSYINALMWNLEKRYRWSYLQNRNRDTDIKNKHRMNCEIETDIYTILCIKLRSWHPVPSVQFSSVQSLSRVWLFATPWIAARQASLSITNSRSSLRLTSIESVMPSSRLILGCPLLLLPPIPPITSWQTDGKTIETVTDCFLGLQSHCRWWLQPWN